MTITVLGKTGTIAVRKAGETLAKSATALSKDTVSQVVNRSVTAEEAPYVTPARESTKVTLMPWKGWVNRYLREFIGEERVQKLRNFWLFMPDDVYDLQPIKPGQKIAISEADPNLTRAYRYPSPGSEGPVKLPHYEDDEDPFDSGYYKRNTKRRWRDLDGEIGNPMVERAKLFFMDQDDPAVQAEIARLEAGPKSSPGNGGVFATGKSDFDPTGLRATMSASWKELNKSLDHHMPDHIPEPIWMKNLEEEHKHYIDRGIPPPFGSYYMALKIPTHMRIAKW